MKAQLIVFAAIAAAGTAQASTARATPAARPAIRATHILVDKSDRLMHVYAGKREIATYTVGLGTAPLGHKVKEGDRRTPEGRYTLDFKKADSTFFRAIHINYPNARDRAAARQLGVRPGGDIMIHGESNNQFQRVAIRALPSRDYTYGCIALYNEDMEKLWEQVATPIPIEIVP